MTKFGNSRMFYLTGSSTRVCYGSVALTLLLIVAFSFPTLITLISIIFDSKGVV